MERKLTAILCADVFGYSRLMGENEEATLRTLSSYRKTIDDLIEQHHGRFVNSAGDSVLAEFASVVEAVDCAVDIQNGVKAENADLPPDRRMEFRIGVNLGDVMVEGEQIYGDGVNVAARLESLAEPGGICVSSVVHDQVRDKLALDYEDRGDQTVKNIARPVRVFRVLLNGTVAAPTRRIPRSYWRGGAFSMVGLAIILTTVILVQHLSLRPPHTQASIPPTQSPALSLPDKPSIAVLPFTNMSGDHEQEYFSDGITDDLITDLSRFPDLFVIARNSTFTYKGKGMKLQDVSKELGVKYVLEGSVRKTASQVRITVQLADATTGAELWAERYDRPLRDVFALQDEIVRKIVTTLNLQLALSQVGILIPRTTENLEAYDDLLRGMESYSTVTKDGNAKARPMLEKAIALDPNYSAAYAYLGWNYYVGWILGFDPDPKSADRALKMEQHALALDDSMAFAHSALAAIDAGPLGKKEQALAEAQRGIALDPNSASAYLFLGDALNNQRRPEEALAAVEKAIRLDPRNIVIYQFDHGWAYSQMERWKEAIPLLKSCLNRYPEHLWAHAWLAIDYYNIDDRDEAQTQTAEIERAIALSPKSATGYGVLAVVLNAQWKSAEALEAVKKGIRFDPENHLLLLEQATAYSQLGRWEELLSASKRITALYPSDDFLPHVWLAVAYDALGEMDAARAEAQKLDRDVARDPSYDGYCALAEAMNDAGRPAEALAAAEKAMRLKPLRSDYRYMLSRSYTQLERWEEGISALKLASIRDNPWPHVWLAVDYIELANDDAARAEIAKILMLDPQFSIKKSTVALPAIKERATADLRKAGLK